jgi:hypothetical protein
MPKRIDITGMRFGRLVAIRPDKSIKGRWFWICQCDCGKIHSIVSNALRSNLTRSCGCIKWPLVNGPITAKKRHPLYKTWIGMLSRCNYPKDKCYKYYGARGIRVAPHWYDFINFITDIGERPHPSLTLDRIDNDGNYEPDNVKWSTKKEQAANRRNLRGSNGHFTVGM